MAHFNVTRSEFRVIAQIVDRLMEIRAFQALGRTRQDWQMDIEAVHCNGAPLRLSELLEADAFNFAHDIGGIYRHLNRNTGELDNFFVPRYARPSQPQSDPVAVEA